MQTIQSLLRNGLAIKSYKTHIHRYIDATKDSSLVTRIQHNVKFVITDNRLFKAGTTITTDLKELVKDHDVESDEITSPSEILTFENLMCWGKTKDATFTISKISGSQWIPVIDQPHAITDQHPDFDIFDMLLVEIHVLVKLEPGRMPNAENLLSNLQIHRIFTDLVMRGYTKPSK